MSEVMHEAMQQGCSLDSPIETTILFWHGGRPATLRADVVQQDSATRGVLSKRKIAEVVEDGHQLFRNIMRRAGM